MLQIAVVLAIAASNQPTATVTIQSLLHEMADRTAVARLSQVECKLLHASSHDRRKNDPNNPETWHTNTDYGQFIRTEQIGGRKEWVVMEHDGPGAITHIWTPLLGDKDKMLVRIYLDGSETPAIEEPFNDLMRGEEFVKPPFAFISWPEPAERAGVGSDFYYPIPFAKSCKVTFNEVPFYYSFDYKAFPAGTPVETFSRAAMDAAAPVASEVGRDLQHPEPGVEGLKGFREVKLTPGKDYSMRLPHGPSAVRWLEVRFDHAPDPQDLRSNVIEMSFDGERTVWCPIGEFFGAGVSGRAVWDRYREVSGDGDMSCCWRMPYQKSGELRFHNLGGKPIGFQVRVVTRPWHWDDKSLHFHTTWRYENPLATRPMHDWNYVTANGEGVYVGDTLTVFNPVAGWYGEGDERIYVDGETLPSHIGTGTEDYYGYAWGMAPSYSSSFIAMPRRDSGARDNWRGLTTTSRVRSLDAIPFKTSIRMDMEIWHWVDCKEAYSAAAFWYARPGATSNREPSPTEAAAPLPVLG